MEAIEFSEQTMVIAKNQPQYVPLPVRYAPDEEGQPMTCCFKLSEEELKEIAETGCLWYTQLTFGHQFQPVRMSTTKPF